MKYKKHLQAKVNQYTILRNNQYGKLRKQYGDLINSLCKKYKTNFNGENSINVKVKFEDHLIHRMGDRDISHEIMSKFATAVCRDHTCELIYLIALDPGKRIQMYYKGYMCGIRGSIHETLDSTLVVIKMHTVYEYDLTKEVNYEYNELFLEDRVENNE